MWVLMNISCLKLCLNFLKQVIITNMNIILQVWKLWEKNSLHELIDPSIQEECIGDDKKRDEVIRCIHIGLLCVQENPTDRPAMSGIHQMLTNSSLVLHVPKPPGFFFPNGPGSNSLAQESGSTQPTSKSFTCSVDDVTITNVNPRWKISSTSSVLFLLLC